MCTSNIVKRTDLFLVEITWFHFTWIFRMPKSSILEVYICFMINSMKIFMQYLYIIITSGKQINVKMVICLQYIISELFLDYVNRKHLVAHNGEHLKREENLCPTWLKISKSSHGNWRDFILFFRWHDPFYIFYYAIQIQSIMLV